MHTWFHGTTLGADWYRDGEFHLWQWNKECMGKPIWCFILKLRGMLTEVQKLIAAVETDKTFSCQSNFSLSHCHQVCYLGNHGISWLIKWYFVNYDITGYCYLAWQFTNNRYVFVKSRGNKKKRNNMLFDMSEMAICIFIGPRGLFIYLVNVVLKWQSWLVQLVSQRIKA